MSWDQVALQRRLTWSGALRHVYKVALRRPAPDALVLPGRLLLVCQVANPEYYFGSNQADIEATIVEVNRRLRVARDVGTLALREHLDLERIELSTSPGDRDPLHVPFEV